MKQRIFFFLLLAVLLAGIIWWWTARRQMTKILTDARTALELVQESGMTGFDGQSLANRETALQPGEKNGGNPLEEAAGLAIQGVKLFQGDKGLELWRLRASWAHLSQEGDVINVDSPHVVYALGDKGLPPAGEGTDVPSAGSAADAAETVQNPDLLDVTAQKGRLAERQRYLSLWGNVVITRASDKISGPRMEYDSLTRIMTFPDGATLESKRGCGTAKILQWDLEKNEITCPEGIEILLIPQPEAG